MKIIFDIDDVLNNLVEHTYELAGIEYNKYIGKDKYLVEECKNISIEEQKKVVQLWQEENTYLTCTPQEGISEISKISSLPGIIVCIHSYCENNQAALGKINWVNKYIDTKNINFIMELKNKTPINDADIIVEDNIEYLIKYKNKIKILIDKPYNKGENYGIDEKENQIYRVKSTKEAIEHIKELIELGQIGNSNI